MPELKNTEAPVRYSKKNPFLARLTQNVALTKPGSQKETRHFVIDVSGSGITYLPGDSIAVTARNPEDLVDALIHQLGFDGDAEVDHKRCGRKPLREALRRDFIINRPLKKMMTAMEPRLPDGPGAERLKDLLADDAKLTDYLFTRDYIDILRDFPEMTFEKPEDFLDLLGPMQPRLYSIASCQEAHPNEVHMIIAVVRYHAQGRPRTGLASGWLADHAELNVNDIPVFITPSKFRLPEDPSVDIIMVGPGTGIAPFRAFMEKRELEGATGRNWLFFGEQHRAYEFFYEEDWIRFQEKGLLTRLDTAFSRDQEKKIYVQHRMLENSRELWRWLQNGAYFYVCGDAKRMAKDVHQALIDIAQKEGGLSKEAAEEYVNVTLMREEKRYRRDVY